MTKIKGFTGLSDQSWLADICLGQQFWSPTPKTAPSIGAPFLILDYTSKNCRNSFEDLREKQSDNRQKPKTKVPLQDVSRAASGPDLSSDFFELCSVLTSFISGS